MNTSQSNVPTRRLARLWKRFQHWRAMRIYARIPRMHAKAARLYAKANLLIGRNVRQPMPLFPDEGER